MLWVNQAGEWDGVLLEVCLRVPSGVVEDGDDLHTRSGELLALLRQLTEVPSAERSFEATQEHEDNASPAPVVAERDVSSHRIGQCEIWRW